MSENMSDVEKVSISVAEYESLIRTDSVLMILNEYLSFCFINNKEVDKDIIDCI